MATETIIYVIVTLCSIALAVFNLIYTKHKKGEPVTLKAVVETVAAKIPTLEINNELYDKMLSYITMAEKTFSAFKSIPNSDTATMKLNDVLNKIRSDCANLGVQFDETYWVGEIKAVIDVTNQVNVTKK